MYEHVIKNLHIDIDSKLNIDICCVCVVPSSEVKTVCSMCAVSNTAHAPISHQQQQQCTRRGAGGEDTMYLSGESFLL